MCELSSPVGPVVVAQSKPEGSVWLNGGTSSVGFDSWEFVWKGGPTQGMVIGVPPAADGSLDLHAYSHWAPGSPAQGDFKEGTCLALSTGANATRWVATSCDTTLSLVCVKFDNVPSLLPLQETPPVPTPTAIPPLLVA